MYARGGSRGERCIWHAPPLKLEKRIFFWHKIVVFHTKYPKKFRASLRSPPNLKSWIHPCMLTINYSILFKGSIISLNLTLKRENRVYLFVAVRKECPIITSINSVWLSILHFAHTHQTLYFSRSTLTEIKHHLFHKTFQDSITNGFVQSSIHYNSYLILRGRTS
jgi:hypothetical protein